MNKKGINILLIIIFIIVGLNYNAVLGFALIIAIILYVIYRNLPMLFMMIGNKKYLSKNIEEAMPWYELSYKFNHNKPTVLINYAYILLKKGDIEKSESILKDVLRNKLNDKDKINVNLNLSLIFWKKGNVIEAINLLEALYNEDYKTTLLYQNLGFYYIINGNLDRALEFNKEAYNYNDSDTSILDNLAMNYYFMNDYDKAFEIYHKLIPMKPAFVTTYYYYGLALEKVGKYEEALESLKKTLNYRFSFLSSVSKDEVQNEINKLNNLLTKKSTEVKLSN